MVTLEAGYQLVTFSTKGLIYFGHFVQFLSSS